MRNFGAKSAGIKTRQEHCAKCSKYHNRFFVTGAWVYSSDVTYLVGTPEEVVELFNSVDFELDSVKAVSSDVEFASALTELATEGYRNIHPYKTTINKFEKEFYGRSDNAN